MASHSDRQAAVNKAASHGLNSLSGNERVAFDEACRESTSLGRSASNIANGKKPGESDRNFLGF